MAYEPTDWNDGDVITADALDKIENALDAADSALDGKADDSDIVDMLTKTEAGKTYATKAELAAKAAKGSAIVVEDAAAAGSETITKAEFDKVVALANALKAEVNKMNA